MHPACAEGELFGLSRAARARDRLAGNSLSAWDEVAASVGAERGHERQARDSARTRHTYHAEDALSRRYRIWSDLEATTSDSGTSTLLRPRFCHIGPKLRAGHIVADAIRSWRCGADRQGDHSVGRQLAGAAVAGSSDRRRTASGGE